MTEAQLEFALTLVTAVFAHVICTLLAAYLRRPTLAFFGAGVVSAMACYAVIKALLPSGPGMVIGCLVGLSIGASTYLLTVYSTKSRNKHE